MSLRELPSRPNLEHLKNQARRLLEEALASDAAARARFLNFGVVPEKPKLADALHVVAREYGFATWPALKLQVEASSEDAVEALTAALQANDGALVRGVLARHPSLRAQINQPLPNYGFDAPALIAAVQKENREAIDALLEAGANIHERTRWWAGGFGVLDSASPALAEYLISRGARVDIHAAARLGRVERVRELLAGDASLVHARGGDGQLPLHFAATVEIAGLLLDHGADMEARDIDHESTAAQYLASTKPYRGAQASDRHAVVRFLLSRGAQADILMASAVGELGIVERLVNHDPEIIYTTVSERWFPKRDPKSGGCIYLYGFGITKSPHMLAHQFGHRAVFDLLMQRSAPWLRLSQAAELGDEALAKQILTQHPALFTRLSPKAARRLVGAAVRNNARAIALLVQNGWPVNATLDNGQTALHYACWHGNAEMVRVLLAHNAPVNVFEREHNGSPLGWALHGSLHSWERSKGDYPDVTLMMLKAGATVPQPERPLEATDEVLDVIKQYG